MGGVLGSWTCLRVELKEERWATPPFLQAKPCTPSPPPGGDNSALNGGRTVPVWGARGSNPWKAPHDWDWWAQQRVAQRIVFCISPIVLGSLALVLRRSLNNHPRIHQLQKVSGRPITNVTSSNCCLEKRVAEARTEAPTMGEPTPKSSRTNAQSCSPFAALR